MMTRKLSAENFAKLVYYIYAHWENPCYSEYTHPKTGYQWTISAHSVIVWNLAGEYIAILLKGK